MRSVKSKLFVLAFLILSLFITATGWAAYPALVYVTSDYCSGSMGTITLDDEGHFKVKPNQVVGLNGDAAIFTYPCGSETRVWVTSRSSWGNDEDLDAVHVYRLGHYEDKSWIFAGSRGTNVYTTETDENWIYLNNFQNGTVSTYDINTFERDDARCMDLKAHLREKGYPVSSCSFLRQYEGYLYALVMCCPKGAGGMYNTGPGFLFKLDPDDMSIVALAKVGINAGCGMYMGFYDGAFYVHCFGGMMMNDSGNETAIYRVDAKAEPTIPEDGGVPVMPSAIFLDKASISKAVGEHFVFNNFLVDEDGTVFFMAYFNNGWPPENRLCLAHMDDLMSTFDPDTGSLASLDNIKVILTEPKWLNYTRLDTERDILWVSCHGSRMGDSYIAGFNYEGKEICRFSGKELGNLPYSFAVVPARHSGNSAPEEVKLVSPHDGETGIPADKISLTWNCFDPDGDGMTYTVWAGSDPQHLVPLATRVDIPGRTFVPDKNLFLGETEYCWKITACDGQEETDSEVGFFTTAPTEYVVEAEEWGVGFQEDDRLDRALTETSLDLGTSIDISVAKVDVAEASADSFSELLTGGALFKSTLRKIEIEIPDSNDYYTSPIDVKLTMDIEGEALRRIETLMEMGDDLRSASLKVIDIYKQIDGVNYDLAKIAKDTDTISYPLFFGAFLDGTTLTITTKLVLTSSPVISGDAVEAVNVEWDERKHDWDDEDIHERRFFVAHCPTVTGDNGTYLLDPIAAAIAPSKSGNKGVGGGGCQVTGMVPSVLLLILPLFLIIRSEK